jgi:hypothetical protein
MAHSYIKYSGNGATSKFALAFIGGSALRKDHVKVYVGGVEQLPNQYSIDNGVTEVTFGAGAIPPSGTNNIVIKRVTPETASQRVVDFAPGSVLTAKDLDESSLNALYASQETKDANALVFDPVSNVVDGNGVTITDIELDLGPVP